MNAKFVMKLKQMHIVTVYVCSLNSHNTLADVLYICSAE